MIAKKFKDLTEYELRSDGYEKRLPICGKLGELLAYGGEVAF